jgi:predicted nucleotidyltransferase
VPDCIVLASVHVWGVVFGMVVEVDLGEIKEILRLHKKDLRDRFSVRRIGVFGSYVRGMQRRGSDVDVLVEFEEPIGLFDFMDLEDYLSGLLGVRVDLVSKKALKPVIGEYILSEVVYV